VTLRILYRSSSQAIYYRLFIVGEQASQDIAGSAAATAAAAARTGLLSSPTPR